MAQPPYIIILSYHIPSRLTEIAQKEKLPQSQPLYGNLV